MPKVQCPVCGAEISTESVNCPKCGNPNTHQSQGAFFKAEPQPNENQPSSFFAQPEKYPNIVLPQPPPESPRFAFITLAAYLFFYPLGLTLNITGLGRGPKQGCFVWLLLVFVVLPIILLVLIMAFGSPSLWLRIDDTLRGFQQLKKVLKIDRLLALTLNGL